MGVKISELAEANSIQENNLLPIVQNGETKKIRIDTFFSQYPQPPYTRVSGTYTTAVWSEGTNNCIWTAPKTGLYIIFGRFDLVDDSKAQIYKQLQLKGTANRINGDLLLYQPGPSTATSNYQGIAIFAGSMLVYAQQGQTIIPYIHTPQAGIEWNVTLTGLFLK